MASKQLQVSFDELNRARLLDAEVFAQTESLADEASSFAASTLNVICFLCAGRVHHVFLRMQMRLRSSRKLSI